ncbi:MAG: glycosyltransferase family 1 protein [Rhodoglobus sp.]|nr:glycosyltransferase family 1 protein [Rhodoglobus sp.]
MPLVLVDLLSYTGTKGGMESYTRELYRAIGAAGSEFTFVGIASTEGYRLDHSWFPGDVLDSGTSGENRFRWAWGELVEVSRWARRLDAQLIHSPATLGPMRSRVPTILTMHDMLYFSHPEYMSTPLYTLPVRWMEKRAAANASRIIAISDWTATQITKYLHVAPDRLQVVLSAGMPVTTAPERPLERATDLILAIGNRRPHKNFEGLVRALALVDASVRPRLVITGSRGDDPLRPIVERLGLEPWVTLREWVPDDELETLRCEATALAMPSFDEGFGLPVLDAMAVGLPVIISDIPVFREIAGDAAIYFDPKDDAAIAKAIAQVVADPAVGELLAERGYAQAAKFSWADVASGTLDAFRTAIANPRRSRVV